MNQEIIDIKNIDTKLSNLSMELDTLSSANSFENYRICAIELELSSYIDQLKLMQKVVPSNKLSIVKG